MYATEVNEKKFKIRPIYMVLKNFTIFGERNSGTNYLENLLKKVLYINFTNEYGFKHWYIKGLNPRGINNTND